MRDQRQRLECILCELLYADHLVPLNETIERLRDKFLKWNKAFESKGSKVILWENQGKVSSGITQDGFFNIKVDSCGFCSLREKANLVLCVQCGRWIHGRCAGVKRVTQKF